MEGCTSLTDATQGTFGPTAVPQRVFLSHPAIGRLRPEHEAADGPCLPGV